MHSFNNGRNSSNVCKKLLNSSNGIKMDLLKSLGKYGKIKCVLFRINSVGFISGSSQLINP